MMNTFMAPRRAGGDKFLAPPSSPIHSGLLLRRFMGRSGFTLLEILVSVVIISVGVLGVTAMQTASVNGQLLARNLDSGFNVIHDALDRMQANSENITEYVKGSYSNPFLIVVNPNDTIPSDNLDRPSGAVAGADYDALYMAMLSMKLSSGTLAVKLTNDFPVTGVDTADAKLTWNYKGKEKKCEITTIITKASRKS